MIKLIHGADLHLDSPFFRPGRRSRRPPGGRSSGSCWTVWPGWPGSGGRPVAAVRRPAGQQPDLSGDRPGPGPVPGKPPLSGVPGPGEPRLLRPAVPVRCPGLAGERTYLHLRGGPAGGDPRAGLCGLWPGLPGAREDRSPWRASGRSGTAGCSSWRSTARWDGRGVRPHLSGRTSPAAAWTIWRWGTSTRPAAFSGRGRLLGLPRLPGGAGALMSWGTRASPLCGGRARELPGGVRPPCAVGGTSSCLWM